MSEKITNTEFIQAVHRKIELKKRQLAVTFSTVMAVFITFISYQAAWQIQNNIYETLWAEYQEQEEEYYTWEILESLTDTEATEYLLDNYEMDDLFELFDNSDELLTTMKTIHWGG